MIDCDAVRTGTFVEEIDWAAESISTNTLALERARSANRLPLLIGADRQTGGRGRGRNSWFAGQGALTFSLLLQPAALNIPRTRWPLLSLTVGLAVCEALEQEAADADWRLKWPNDVYANARKVCGVLIETPADGGETLAIGIGVNVNNSLTEAPADVAARALSLCELTGREHDLTGVLVGLLNSLENTLAELARNPSRLIVRFRRRCLLTGRIVTVADANGSTTGGCLGIEDDGALRVQTEFGPRSVYAGVVTCDELR